MGIDLELLVTLPEAITGPELIRAQRQAMALAPTGWGLIHLPFDANCWLGHDTARALHAIAVADGHVAPAITTAIRPSLGLRWYAPTELSR